MADYIYACPNGGKCRERKLAESGIVIGTNVPNYGMKKAEKFHHEGIPSFIYYKNCTGCYLPLDPSEAVKLNKFLGNTIPDIPIDEDFLKELDEF